MDPEACGPPGGAAACPSAPPDVPLYLRGWLNHVLWLDRLHQCGCRFSLDDLSLDEWRGLEVLNDERNRYERKKLDETKRK